MISTHTRYPGAQPFSDNDLSRKVFFGRQHEAAILTNQILANRLVVVYAKSGLGKTSLLNAGVAQRLRHEGHLPLTVRVNDAQRGPLASVLEGVASEAKRQNVEYIPGSSKSLWDLFDNSEFWCNDILLSPVLILDQFEELFTLQDPGFRSVFLEDLSYIIRGIRPLGMSETNSTARKNLPSLRIVLSLREDYLGFLEEASDRIPQILDHRFRLTPLSLDAAAQAMTGPALIDDSEFETRPFSYTQEAIKVILISLSQRSLSGVSRAAWYVEPFQLQLVCQRIERIVTAKQKSLATYETFSLQDLGGEGEIKNILKDFYIQEIRALPDRRTRRAVRLLCEEYLISHEGRRLSLDEYQIHKQINVSPDTLRYLIDRRLLRSDQRSDSTYYELSHDALVDPVLATRKIRGIIFGLIGTTIGVFMCIWGVIGLLGVAFNTYRHYFMGDQLPEGISPMMYLLLFLIPGFIFILLILWGGNTLRKRSFRMYRRYRRRANPAAKEEIVISNTTVNSELS